MKGWSGFSLDVLLELLSGLIVARIFQRAGAKFVSKNQTNVNLMLARLGPYAAFLQIMLGAAYRREIQGILPHMAGAAIVTSLVLILCVQLIQQESGLQKPATAAMTVILIQVSLGIATFILRLLDLDATLWFTALSDAHIATGAVAFAATLSLRRLIIGDPASHR